MPHMIWAISYTHELWAIIENTDLVLYEIHIMNIGLAKL